MKLRFHSLRRPSNTLLATGALIVTLGGCAQVLGLQDWQDPQATGSSASSSTSAGSSGAGGSGGAATSSVSSASSTTGVTASSSSVGSNGAGGGDVSCADGIKNLDESDVDCGGSCILCGYDRLCGNDGDCASGNCQMGRCGTPIIGCQPVGRDPTCADCTQNGDETDVDCGGVCSPCSFGKSCTNDGECWSASCIGGHCAVGGAGKPCTGAQDCASAQCKPGNCLVVGMCCQ